MLTLSREVEECPALDAGNKYYRPINSINGLLEAGADGDPRVTYLDCNAALLDAQGGAPGPGHPLTCEQPSLRHLPFTTSTHPPFRFVVFFLMCFHLFLSSGCFYRAWLLASGAYSLRT